MSFLNSNLNKPKLNGIKKPSIKMPKLDAKLEVKPKEEVKITQELEFNPSPAEEEVVETSETPEVVVEESTVEEKTIVEESAPEVKEETTEESVEETDTNEEQQQSFDDFKPLEEAVEETEEVKVEEESDAKEEKPKKKTTRKRKTKKAEPVEEVEEESTFESFNTSITGSNDLDFIDEQLLSVVNPTTPAWEEEKVVVNQKIDEIVIDTDMGSLEMDEMLSKLSHLENDVRQRLEEIEPAFLSLQDLVEFVELTAGKGSNASERKATGKIACTRYVKEPGAEPINLYTYLNFQRARYQFYKSKMEQIKNENGRLITLSAVKKLEVNLSR